MKQEPVFLKDFFNLFFGVVYSSFKDVSMIQLLFSQAFNVRQETNLDVSERLRVKVVEGFFEEFFRLSNILVSSIGLRVGGVKGGEEFKNFIATTRLEEDELFLYRRLQNIVEPLEED